MAILKREVVHSHEKLYISSEARDYKDALVEKHIIENENM